MDIRLFGRPVRQQGAIRKEDLNEVSLALVAFLRGQNNVRAMVITNQNLITVRLVGDGIQTSVLGSEWSKIQDLILSGAFDLSSYKVVSTSACESVLADPNSDPLYKQVYNQLYVAFIGD